jgi:hypothetical protein
MDTHGTHQGRSRPGALNPGPATLESREREKNVTRIIFVGGVQRSGTTLVQKILDSHPKIVGGSEFHHIPDIVALRNKMQWSVNVGYMKDYCDQRELDIQIKQVIEKFILNKYDLSSKQYFSEKTPQNSFVFEELIKIFPNAKFVLVIRDTRAVIASMKGVKKRFLKENKRSVPTSVKSIKNSCKHIEHAFEKSMRVYENNKNRFYLIKYEELILEPEKVLKGLCKYLDLEFDAKMLNVGDKKEKNPIIDNLWYTNDQYHRNIDTSSLEKWKKDLARKELDYINYYFKNNKYQKKYGYNFDYHFNKTNYFYLKTFHSIKKAFNTVLGRIISMLKLRGILLKLTEYFRIEILNVKKT